MVKLLAMEKPRTANIVIAIVGLVVVISTFAILVGFCERVGLTFFKYPNITNA
jgi:hypothetical protein